MAASKRRLWFHLDELLPIAEHAMACHHHPPTGAQAAAAGPGGPALILTHTDDGHLATSNGHPRWYDATRTVHAAQARTWRRTGPHRPRGAGRLAGQDTGYLPLLRHASDGAPPVIDLLRAGRHLHRQWATIEHPDPATSGRLLTYQHVDVPEHRDDLVPDGARWTPTLVTLPGRGPGGPYPAWTPHGYTTDDGDLIARFDRHTATRMVTDLATVDRSATMPGEYPVLQFDRDVLVLLDEHDNPHGPPVLTETDRYHPDPDGLYSVGAYLLPWTATGDTA